MNPETFVNMQKQVQENNSELGDFINDLGSWKSSVDAKFHKIKDKHNVTSDLPPVRNSILKKKKKPKTSKKSTPGEGDGSKSVRIKSADYRAWDKFDVDKAMEEMDKQGENKPGNDAESDYESSSTDEEWEDFRRVKLSVEAKNEGNDAFKRGDFAYAIQRYSTAIQLAPENPIFYTNRAMAHLKLGQDAAAELDCTTALKFDSSSTKALFRRALARKNLSKIDDAIVDLKQVLKLEPHNDATRKELAILAPAHQNISVNGISDEAKSKQRIWKTIPIVDVSHQAPSQTRNAADTIKKVSLSSMKLGIPPNFYQFERDLRELNCSGVNEINEATVEYICRIKPESYANIFSNNLTTESLTKILLALVTSPTLPPKESFSCLLNLGKVSRFDLAWMLCPESLRQKVNQLISKCISHGDIKQQEELTSLYL